MTVTGMHHLEKFRNDWKRNYAFPFTAVGDIVVAIIDGQVTVKHLSQEPGGRFFIPAANPDLANIVPEGELKILGVVAGHCHTCRR